MKRPNRLLYRLLTPLVYLAAVFLMLEDWLWDIGERMMAFIASWPPLHALERWIKSLPPYGALIIFVLPALGLLPVKLLALFAITRGHALWGVSVILVAKVVGAAAVARLYHLTKPVLLSLPWFARWHDKFMELKERWIARLRATRAFRQVKKLVEHLQLVRKAAWSGVQRVLAPPPGRRSYLRRLLRRWIAMWRLRRR